MSAPAKLPECARYSFGADEFIFVEIDETMSLEAFFIAKSLADAIESQHIDGVTDICVTNSSLLIRYNPDSIAPAALLPQIQRLEEGVRHEASRTLPTRVFEVPVWYNDPYTLETASRFRKNHQTPDKTDLEFTAEINGLDRESLIEQHHSIPWMITTVGFVAALPFMYQMTSRARQLEAPKYLSPRTDTPRLAVGHAGCFTVIYSVRGAGGYQLLGMAAAPVFDPHNALADFSESMVLFRSGDIVKFKSIDEAEYEAISARCENGTFRYQRAELDFDLDEWRDDPDTYNKRILEALRGSDH